MSPTSLRKGFTLVELLVALMLMAMGAMAWVVTGTNALRVSSSAQRETDAMLRARRRAGLVAGTRCDLMAGGGTAEERWEVQLAGNGIRVIVAEAEYVGLRGPRTATYALAVSC